MDLMRSRSSALRAPFTASQLAGEHLLEVGRSFLGKFADLLLDLVDHGLGLVLGVDELGALLVFLGVELRLRAWLFRSPLQKDRWILR